MRAGPGHSGGGDRSQWIAAGPPKKKSGRMIPVENARPSSFVQVRGAPPPKRTDRLFAPRILIARDCLRKTRDAPSEQHDPLGFSHSHSPPCFAATLRLPPLALDFRQSELHRRTYPSLRPASPSGLFPWMRDVHFFSVSLGHFRRAPQLRPPQLRGLARSERPFASAPPDGGEADSCRERPSRRLSERDSGSASALVGGLGTDWTRHREEGPMRQCQNAPMVAVYPRGCGTSIFSVSHWTILGDLRNCDLHNHGVRCGPKGPSLPPPRTEARLDSCRERPFRRMSEKRFRAGVRAR